MGVPDDGRDREDGRDDDLAAFDFVIPDDLRELDDEVRAYRREQRRERLRRFLLVHRWHRAGLSAPLFVLVLLLVGFVGSMMALIGPTASPPSSRGPLARGDQTPAGQQGGLLPAVDVKVRGDVRPARDLRPAVLAIVPPGCACETLLNEVFDQAQAYRLTMYVVGRSSQEPELTQLVHRVGNGTAGVVIDTEGVLTASTAARGITLVLVHSDGVIGSVLRDIPPGLRIEPLLARLPNPGATALGPAPAGSP
ncbi:hypothetical protein C3Y87_17780 [Carbonactinospora thermoautotrophica]|uniref:Uncharacterized protein n=2 Tax=Carbonactinospora thermoautotrophica TaxID=1469144 RepID=A0A132MJK6_9ACTN|nr:hypothetical protein [Carbonactinospora thermoautotrophica]KWW98034.1 hypothetical protein TH66_22215 [Carbonactinospora thermoautotrophica]MCX9193216.1 hypothetical protein [Carbonactinospora thermoautotrophica]